MEGRVEGRVDQSKVASLIFGMLDRGTFPAKYLECLSVVLGAAFTGEWGSLLKAKVGSMIESARAVEVLPEAKKTFQVNERSDLHPSQNLFGDR